VLADLIQSLLVTVLVLGLPGYYWARLLFPHLDWVEQGAFTVALSMTLVPAVALLLAWGWGPGVSWSIAAASVALVTLVGAAVFARFGAAPVLALHPKLDFPTLGPLALAPLIPAALLMIAVFLGIFGHRSVALPITLLVLLSAAFFVVLQVRRTGEAASDPPSADAAPDEEPTDWKTNPRLRRMEEGVRLLASRRVALPLVFLLVLVRGYSGPVLHDWPYIRGVDQYVHAVMVNLVMTQGDAKSFSVYPPGFHVLTAVLSRLSGLEPIQLFPYVAPALLLMPTVACYVLAQRLLGDRYGLAAAIFAGLLLSSPARFLNDGTYVDLMTAEFLLPLAIAALILLLEAPSRQGAVLFALIGSSVVLYHTIAAYYFVLLLVLVCLVCAPYLLLRDRRLAKYLTASLAFLGGLSVAYAWRPYDLPRTVGGLLGYSDGTATSTHAMQVIGTQPPLALRVIPNYLSIPLVQLGLLGLLLLAVHLRRIRASYALGVLLLIGWCLVFLFASQTSLSGFPWRFTRDLGIPLSVAAAFGLVAVLSSLGRARPTATIAAALLALTVVLFAEDGMAASAGPSRLLLLTPEYEAAGRWLREHNTGGSIITSPYLNQATLAMGGYTLLPTVTENQVDDGRTVPVRFQQHVQDVQWVYDHARDERTNQIYALYDVRYLALAKSLPENIPRRGAGKVTVGRFKSQPDLYDVVFENNTFVIFEVKQQQASK